MGREREIAKTGFFLNYVRHALRSFTLTLSFPIQFLGEVRLYPWTRQWHPTPVLLPGKSHGQRSLVGCSPWGREELDTTERLHFHFSLSCIGEGHGNPLQCSCLGRIPEMGEAGGLPSMGSHRVGHDWSDLAVAVATGCTQHHKVTDTFQILLSQYFTNTYESVHILCTQSGFVKCNLNAVKF